MFYNHATDSLRGENSGNLKITKTFMSTTLVIQ